MHVPAPRDEAADAAAILLVMVLLVWFMAVVIESRPAPAPHLMPRTVRHA